MDAAPNARLGRNYWVFGVKLYNARYTIESRVGRFCNSIQTTCFGLARYPPRGRVLRYTNPDKHEAWARAIELRYQGGGPKEAPFPTPKCDEGDTEEVAEEEYEAGRYLVPRELYKK